MFDSVLGRGVGAPGRPGVGAAVSLSLHALVFAVALLMVAPPSSPQKAISIHWPPISRGERTRPSGAPSTSAPLKARRPGAVKPRTAEARAPIAPGPAEVGDLQPGDVEPGSGTESPGEGSCASPPCSPDGKPGAEGDVLVLGPQMVAPRLLQGPEPHYPAAALLQQLGGTVVVRCTVTDRGNVQDCRLVKSVPLLDEAALQAVQGRHYAPAVYEGRAVSVWMNLPVRFLPPSL
jgi:periplasmic protein TonB